MTQIHRDSMWAVWMVRAGGAAQHRYPNLGSPQIFRAHMVQTWRLASFHRKARVTCVFIYIRSWSIALSVLPTRRRWDYPSRTPAPRYHNSFGARNGVLISPSPGQRSVRRPTDCSLSSECGPRQVTTCSFSGMWMRLMRQRAGKSPAPQWTILSPDVPSYLKK